MKIPTTEFCTECEVATPKDQLAKSGRARVRVYQDLDTGEYSCEHGHKVIIESGVLEPQEAQLLAKGLEDVKAGRTTPLEEVREGLQPAQDTAVAVAEEPQTYQAQIVPGSSRMRQGGALELTLVVPEQYVGPLQSYCQGIQKSPEEFINEVVANGFENGWFV